MRTDHHHATSSSHIRPLTLSASGAGHRDDGNPGRFDETGRLTEQRTDAIVKALVKLKIGDRASCSLFVRAMEYQLPDFRHALAAEPEPAPAEPAPQAIPAAGATELAAIARAAHELAVLLEALPDDLAPGLLQHLEAQDEMRRGYDQRYLDQLRVEALRLAAACSTEVAYADPVPAPVAQAETPAVSAAGVDFVASLGNMFEECFEKQATTKPDGPFARALGVLSEGIGIEIPYDPATLEAALGTG